MNTINRNNTVLTLAVLLFLWTVQPVSAFYSPSAQRWVTRDPIGEPGFEILRGKSQSPIREHANLYEFVANSPIALTDAWGLTTVETTARDDRPPNKMSASVTYPPPGCPKNHVPCGRLIGSKKVEDKKKDTCVQTCSYRMSKANPYASLLLGKGAIFIGDGNFGSSNTITEQGDHIQIDITTSCDRDCPGRVACGDRNEDGSSWSRSKRKSRQIPEIIFVDF